MVASVASPINDRLMVWQTALQAMGGTIRAAVDKGSYECIKWSHPNNQWQMGMVLLNVQATRKKRITPRSAKMMSW
jgi:hypothetical protein